jgi:4-diphosphocytidyl-2C-methyl-D-erythritol kinase
MRGAGTDSVAISGAGPAHYTVVTDGTQAEQVAARLRGQLGDHARVFVARPAPPRS